MFGFPFLKKKRKLIINPPDKYSDLNPKQREAVFANDRILAVTSCPGSGKTRTLTYRIARLLDDGVEPSSIVAVTFTNKAANTMKSRLFHLVGDKTQLLNVSTLHSFGYKLLRTYGDAIGVSEYHVADTNDTLRLAKKLSLTSFPEPSQVLEAISKAKSKCLLADDIVDLKLRSDFLSYQDALKDAKLIDFDDLILLPAYLLQTQPSIADMVHNTYKHILVDEMQDLNRAQVELIKAMVVADTSLFMVGDLLQSIYGWRTADPRYVEDFISEFEDTKLISLDINYRSYQEILNAAFKLIKNDPWCFLDGMTSKRGCGFKPVIVKCTNSFREADFVTNTIIYSPALYKDMAVLYRTKWMATAFQRSLLSSSVPFKIRGGTFVQSPEIRPLVAYLRYVNGDSNAIFGCVNIPPRRIGASTLRKEVFLKGGLSETDSKHKGVRLFKKLISAVYTMLEEQSASYDVLDHIIHTVDYVSWAVAKYGDSAIDDTRDNIEALLRLASEHPRLSDLIDIISILDVDDVELANGDGKVTLSTIHAAKGLEWPIVFVVGVEDGIIPYYKSFNDERAMDEERRLMYVAMTRAADRLYMTYSLSRMDRGVMVPRLQSRYLNDISTNCEVTSF